MTAIPTTAADFERWRKKQTFATEGIRQRAFLVGRDMQTLERLGDKAPASLLKIAKEYRAGFEAMLAAS